MKKTFRTILAGAVALLAVSCYDDSDLRGQLGDLDERLDKVEATLNAETGGIADLLGRIETLEGKIAAIKVETDAETGLTTLTLSDGSSVALSKNGVLTIVDGGWATVAANGTVTPLGIKVAHPKLAFKVEGGELKVSYDGTTYEATGVKVSEYTAHVIGDVVVAEDGKSVTVKIGDKNLELPLVTSNAAAIGLNRDEMFLAYGVTKSVRLTTTDIEKYNVYGIPDGWRVSVDESTLTITAPSADLAEIGAGALSGKIIIHATDVDGYCKEAELTVKTGDAVKLTVKDGNISLFNALVETNTDWEGFTSTNFVDVYVGLTPVSEFMQFTPEEFFAAAGAEYFYGFNAAGFANAVFNKDNNLPTEYKENQYEEFNHTLSIEEFAKVIATVSEDGFEYDPEANYVVWCLPASQKMYYDYAQYTFINPVVLIESEESELTDISLNVSLFGADEFYLSVYEKTQIAMYLEMEGGFETYLTMGPYYQGGPWQTFLQGDVTDMGKVYPEGVNTIKLSDIYTGYTQINPETEYCVLAFPYYKGKSHESYVFATDVEPYLIKDGIKTADLMLNEDLKATVSVTATPYSVTHTITPPDGGKTHYYFTSEEELTDEAFHQEAQYSYVEEEDMYTQTYNITPETTYYLYTYSVTGKEKGKIQRETITTPKVSFDDNVNVKLTSLVPNEDGSMLIATFSVTGANKVGVYVRSEGSEQNVIKYAFGDSWSLTRALVNDGIATVEFRPYTYPTLYVIGYNVADTSIDGQASNVTSVGNLATYTIADELNK